MQIESIFNQHPKIKRTALIKLNINGLITPSLVIERHDKNVKMTDSFLRELLVLRDSEEFTKPLHQFFLHPGFPVDVRHNIKIDRIKLSSWAQSQHS
jgi:hypothetical protein